MEAWRLGDELRSARHHHPPAVRWVGEPTWKGCCPPDGRATVSDGDSAHHEARPARTTTVTPVLPPALNSWRVGRRSVAPPRRASASACVVDGVAGKGNGLTAAPTWVPPLRATRSRVGFYCVRFGGGEKYCCRSNASIVTRVFMEIYRMGRSN